jgi:hypothetical protein
MKAKMSILNVSVINSRIRPVGGWGPYASVGHQFDFDFEVRVVPRTLNALSGEGIDCPDLQWRERIDWFEYHQDKGWVYVGQDSVDMYARNPNSNTFARWNNFRYVLARDPSNKPPPELASCDDDKAAKHWIAKNGFSWKLSVTDVPSLGKNSSGSPDGFIKVRKNSRRRVIYFDLGFEGQLARCKFVQILETLNGLVTIHKLINANILKSQIDNPHNLNRWRTQVLRSNSYTF